MSKSGSMMNPFEYRELMAAAVGWSDKSPDDVLAEQAARHKAKAPKSKKASDEPPPPAAAPKSSELAKLQAIIALGKQVRGEGPE